jgi:hypothetical protein
MKQPASNNQLDSFLREKLKSHEGNLPTVDWSELEVLLIAKKQPISVAITKKQIFVFALVILAAGGSWGLFEAVQYYRSLPAENAPSMDSLQNTFSTVDTVKPVQIDTVIAKTDTAETDSLVITEQKTDSVLKEADAFLKNINSQQVNITEKSMQQKDKKQKQNKIKNGVIPVDSSALTMPIEIIPPLDTTFRKKPVEIKTLPADTVKTSAPAKKSKKGKNKKGVADSTKTLPKTELLPAKPDSVK